MCRNCGSDNLLLHHSLDLVSSLIDYMFMKSLDKCVVIIINLMSSSRISTGVMMRNTVLALDDLRYHRPLLPSHQHKLVRVWCYTLSSLLSSNCSSLPWNINISYILNVVRISPPLKNSWYGDTSHHHHSSWVLVLIPTRVPTSERCCLDSALLATILL